MEASGNPYAIKLGLKSNFTENRVYLVSAFFFFTYWRVQTEDLRHTGEVDGNLGSGVGDGFLKHV